MPQAQPELKKVCLLPSWHTIKLPEANLIKYLDKRLFVQLNGSRKVIGVLRGYDVRPPFPLLSLRACLQALVQPSY
jgi:hypothetical protein